MGQISSAPVELIRVQRCGGAGWRGAAAEMQGWRADQEDAHFVAVEHAEAARAVLAAAVSYTHLRAHETDS